MLEIVGCAICTKLALKIVKLAALPTSMMLRRVSLTATLIPRSIMFCQASALARAAWPSLAAVKSQPLMA